MESISTLSQAFSNLPGSSSIFLVEAEFTARALLLPRLHRQVYAQALAQSISENVEWHSMAQLSDQSTAALSCQQFCDYVEAFHLRLRNWEITRFTTPVATSFATNFLELFQFAISEAKTIRQASLEPATSVELELGFGAKKARRFSGRKKAPRELTLEPKQIHDMVKHIIYIWNPQNANIQLWIFMFRYSSFALINEI